MKLGDRVVTPEGEGTIDSLHCMRKNEKDRFGNDCSYSVYAVKLLENSTILYFEPKDVKRVRVVYAEDRLTGTLYQMEIVDD